MKFENKRLLGIVVGVGLLLLVAYIAMRLMGDVKWSSFDFVAAGVMLLGAGLALEVALRLVRKTSYRIALCAAILFALFIIWAELAVGLIGTPLAGS